MSAYFPALNVESSGAFIWTFRLYFSRAIVLYLPVSEIQHDHVTSISAGGAYCK